MSRIRRLSVRGIRNFSDNDEATIRFSRPLTLILGSNGTGKTTIIEALKFASCGEFPPGSDRGKCFIHDPTLSTTSSVRGVVKAEIIDTVGNLYTICRTIESIKVGLTIRFKTLDSALSRVNKGSKEVISITNRCANVDTELTVVMGVSKPILDYVIFCHQEHLNWPFEDGKKLKEKFDEIFDSARFNKALESIMKYIKDLKQRVNILKEQKQNCQLIVNEVEEKEAKLADLKKRLENSKTKIEELNKDLEPVNRKIKELEKVDADYKDLQSEERRKKAEYDMYKQQVNRLKENMQYVFEGTTEELLKQIDTYDERLIGKTDEIKEFQGKLKDIAQEESRISDILVNERVTTGSLKQQIKDQEKKVAIRNKILNETLSAWNLDNADSDVSELEVIALSKRLEEKMREQEQKVEENRVKREGEEKELQRTVDVLRSECSKLNLERNLKENEVIDARKEINKIKMEITELNTSACRLDAIESQVKELQTKIQKLNETLNVDAVKEEIAAKIKSRDETEVLLNTVDEEISSLLKQSSLQAELEINKDTLLTKEKEVETLKNKHKQKIMTLLNIKELSQIKLKDNLDIVQKELINELEFVNREIQKEECQITTLETTISHIELELQNKKKEMDLDKEKISSICHYKNYDETLLLQSKLVKDLQNKRGMYAHQNVAYKEYMKQLKETNPSCPLCHRGFNERETVVKLLKKMECEMEIHPNRLKECEKELKIQQEKYDKMLQLKSVVEKIIKLEEVELEKLMDNLKKLKNKLSESKINLTQLRRKKSNPENKLTMCKDIIGDIMLWDRYIDEISKLKQKINDLRVCMIAAGIKTERNLEEAQTQREELKMFLKRVRDNIEKLQTKISIHNEKMHNAQQDQSALYQEQLKIRLEVPKLKQLKDKQHALYSKEISLGKLIDTLREKLVAAENKLQSGINKLEEKKKDNWEKHESDRKLLAEGIRRLSELHKMQDEVDSFAYCNVPQDLKSSELKIKNCEKVLNEHLKEKSDIEATINKLKEEITHQTVRKRELSDNLTLREIQDTLNNVQQQYLGIREKLDAINYSQVLNQWKNLQNREQVLLRQKNMIKGNQEELERTMQQCNEELRKEIYRQARKNHKSKCIEQTVVEESILNLKAYSRALDAAMIEYHEERMTTINRIMKDMWKLVYKGSDTTGIAIRTNATEGIGNARRTYNYKLVQIKHGHEMDMRGRCSAGQKVLASIIIRLALAETFCKDCGVLALDEPTTNLDQENADSLASALAKVVQLRSQYQKNFQLIVISHDEKFLFKLAELSSNKGFYELYRKETGYTAIRHCTVKHFNHFASDNGRNELSSDEETDNFNLQDYNKKKRQFWNIDNKDSDEERVSKRRFVIE